MATLSLAGCMSVEHTAAVKLGQGIVSDLFAKAPGEWVYREEFNTSDLLQAVAVKSHDDDVFYVTCTSTKVGPRDIDIFVGLNSFEGSLVRKGQEIVWLFDGQEPLKISMAYSREIDGLMAQGDDSELSALRNRAARAEETIAATSSDIDLLFLANPDVVDQLGCH